MLAEGISSRFRWAPAKSFWRRLGAAPRRRRKSKIHRRRWSIAALAAKLRSFLDWVARWTLAPRGMVLRMAMRAPEAAGAEPARIGLRATGAAPETRDAGARARSGGGAGRCSPSARRNSRAAAGVSPGVIDALVDDGALEAIALPPEKPGGRSRSGFLRAELSPDQDGAAHALRDAVAATAFRPILLEGVTGSGKTEVYFEAVAEALRAGGRR